MRLANKKQFGLFFLAIFLTIFFSATAYAQYYGRGEYVGYFDGTSDFWGAMVFTQGTTFGTGSNASETKTCTTPSGTSVTRGNAGIAVDSTGGFIGTIRSRLDGSNTQNSVGASMIVNTIIGNTGPEANKNITSTSAEFIEFEDRVRYYDEVGTIQYNECYSFPGGFDNSYYQGVDGAGGSGQANPEDDAWYEQDGPETQLAIIFRDHPDTPDDIDYLIKMNCGNVAGVLGELPERPDETARVEVRKVNESGDSSADGMIHGQGVRLNAGSPRYANPLTYNDVPLDEEHTLSVTVPSGWVVSYTICQDRTNCHSYPANATGGSSVKFTINDDPDNPDQFMDVYWHFDKIGERANLNVQTRGLPEGSTITTTADNHRAGDCGNSFSVTSGSNTNCTSGETGDGLACHNNSVSSTYHGIGCADGLRLQVPSTYPGGYTFVRWEFTVSKGNSSRAQNCSYTGSGGQCVNLYPSEAAIAVAVYERVVPPSQCDGTTGPSEPNIRIVSYNKEDPSQQEGPADYDIYDARGWWYHGESNDPNEGPNEYKEFSHYEYPDGSTGEDPISEEGQPGEPVYDVWRYGWYSTEHETGGNYPESSSNSDTNSGGSITFHEDDDRGFAIDRYLVEITDVPQNYYDQRISQHNWDGRSNQRIGISRGKVGCIEMQPTWQLSTQITTDPQPEPLEPYQTSPYSMVTEVCNNSDTWSTNESPSIHTVERDANAQVYVEHVSQRRLGSTGSSNGDWQFNNIELNKVSCTSFEFEFRIDGDALRGVTTDDEIQVCFTPAVEPYRRDNRITVRGSQECYDVSVPIRPFFLALGNDVHAGAEVTTGVADEVCDLTTRSSIVGQRSGSAGTRGQYSVSASGDINSIGSNNRSNSELYTFGRDGDYNVICRPDYRLLPSVSPAGSNVPVITNARFINDIFYPNNRITYIDSPTGNVRINSLTVPKGSRKTLLIEGDVDITGDITYQDGYSSRNEIPALAIIATGEIRIHRNVSNISGYLVAYDAIDTCGDVSRSADSETWVDNCRQQLLVNGAVVGEEILLRRTFGDALNTVNEPAEIFRFRPEAYLAPAPGLFGTAREIFDVELFNERPPVF